MLDVFHRRVSAEVSVARSADPCQRLVRVRGMHVFDGDVGVDAEEPDEVDRVSGFLCLVQDAVGPHLPRQQPDLVEGSPQRT
ncbi:hypothetical protein [Streptomyces sp. NPDC093984]|uniref:hypothetical protein n=1 Tax=Streptomyces sp. NPDC093984 TaxID=3366052 RepID=UPI003823CA6C